MTIRVDNRVAIVTGAGNGLGRSHALALAARGAKVIVNDFGGARDGSGGSSEAAQKVVHLVEEQGGIAIADGANVTNYSEVEAMVRQAMEKWGRVDILINNAGILRDKTFSKMSLLDFRAVVEVHLMGTVNCTKAVWDIMKKQQYGRIVMTSSSSGLYGNFGQSNYSAAKMAVVGLMNTLVMEGEKYNIRVNTLSPAAVTRMTEDLIQDENIFGILTPKSVSAALLALCHEDAPNRLILCSGGGVYASTRIYETKGIYLAPEKQTPENIVANLDKICASDGQEELTMAAQQSEKFVNEALLNSKNISNI